MVSSVQRQSWRGLWVGAFLFSLLTAPGLFACSDDGETDTESTETGDGDPGDGDPGDGDPGDGDPGDGDPGDGDPGDGDPGDGDGDPGDGDGDPGLSAELVEPAELVSSGGALVEQIEILYADNTIIVHDPDSGEVTGVDFRSRTYAGTIPGPTLRLQQGDLVDVELINSLPENPDQDVPIADHNWPHHLNSTNFHLHGFHVDPTGDGDNVLRQILPQTTAAVNLDVPQNHNPGTHWYHGHKHGSLAVQFYSGMSGMIIVEGDVDQVPEVAAADEKIMIFQELGLNNQGEVPDPDLDAPDVAGLFADITQRYYPINGIVNPIIRMQPGEVQRWRMLNSTLASIMNLELEGHDLYPIAADGVTYTSVDQVPALQMAPGDRFDVLVQAGAAGTYQLTSPMGMGPMMSNEVMATIVVEGDPVAMDLPSDLPAPDYILPDATAESPDVVHQISFEAGMGPGEFTISGLPFNHDCVNYILQLGDVVDWEITNNAGPGAHPFHIHTNAFQVLEVNGVPEDPPRWHDVVPVPGNGGSVLARMRVDDFVGGLVLHCHIVVHEEAGMMHNVVIVDDAIPQDQKVPADQVDLSDPANLNPAIPGYYVSENFTLCQ